MSQPCRAPWWLLVAHRKVDRNAIQHSEYTATPAVSLVATRTTHPLRVRTPGHPCYNRRPSHPSLTRIRSPDAAATCPHPPRPVPPLLRGADDGLDLLRSNYFIFQLVMSSCVFSVANT